MSTDNDSMFCFLHTFQHHLLGRWQRTPHKINRLPHNSNIATLSSVHRESGRTGKSWAEIATLVTPETLLAWHRKLIAQKYDGSGQRKPGRPRTAGEIEALVVRMAEENRGWGYRRIQGRMIQSGVRHCPEHDCRDSETARH